MTEQVSGLSEQKAITDGCQGALAGGAVSESLLEGRWAGMGEGGPLPPHPPAKYTPPRQRCGGQRCFTVLEFHSDGDGSQF